MKLMKKRLEVEGRKGGYGHDDEDGEEEEGGGGGGDVDDGHDAVEAD
jgi:hypothetical protein